MNADCYPLLRLIKSKVGFALKDTPSSASGLCLPRLPQTNRITPHIFVPTHVSGIGSSGVCS